jgi:uncharacterized protein YxjI
MQTPYEDDAYDERGSNKNPPRNTRQQPYSQQQYAQQQYPQQQQQRLVVDDYNAPHDTSAIDDFLGAFDAPAPTNNRQQPPSQQRLPPPPVRTVSQPRTPQRETVSPPKSRPVQYDDYEYEEPKPVKTKSKPQRPVEDYDEYDEPKAPNTKPKARPQRELVDEDYYDDNRGSHKKTTDKKKSSGGVRHLRLVHSATHGSTRQVTVIDEQSPEDEHIFRAFISLDPLKIKIEDASHLPVIEVKQKLLALHPSFQIKHRGAKFGSCTQRFKVNSKKFNYERADTKEVLKMVGEYGYHFAVKKNEKIIAKIVDKRSELDVEIESVNDEEHIICMCMIMLQQRFLGVMGKQVEFE